MSALLSPLEAAKAIPITVLLAAADRCRTDQEAELKRLRCKHKHGVIWRGRWGRYFSCEECGLEEDAGSFA